MDNQEIHISCAEVTKETNVASSATVSLSAQKIDKKTSEIFAKSLGAAAAAAVQTIIPSEELPSLVRATEDLTLRFGEEFSKVVEEVIRTVGYADDAETRKTFPMQITRGVSQLMRSQFPMIYHAPESAYYVYNRPEKVFLEVNRERLVESGLAYFEQAQIKVETELEKPWQLLMKEKALRNQIQEGIKPNLGVTNGEEERNILAFQNAIVDLTKTYADAPEGQKLLNCAAPDGKVFSTHTIAANLVAVHKRPEVWGQALRMMGFDTEEMMSAVENILLYLITPALGREEMFYWYGKGSNGKSVLIKLLRAIVGERHVGSVSLDELQANGFAWEGLFGKRLNLPAESGSSGFMDSEKLKAVLTGDAIAVNRKNRPIVSVVLPIKFVFAANRLPVFAEKTHAIHRRFRLLRFDRTVTAAEQIENFHDVLLAQRDEIVSWWLVNHLSRYGKFTPKFSLPPIFEIWKDEAMRGDGDPISGFVDECVLFVDDEKAVVRSKDLLQAFKCYCTKNDINISRWGDRVFYTKITDDFELVKKSNPAALLATQGSVSMTRDRLTSKYYRGIRLVIE